jgi:hypothetical protein
VIWNISLLRPEEVLESGQLDEAREGREVDRRVSSLDPPGVAALRADAAGEDQQRQNKTS